MSTRDVVVVGGGPAGLSAAAAFARALPGGGARRVVVLERSHYPRDKPCAGALGRRGDRILESLGVRPDVPSVPIDGIAFRARGGEQASVPGGIGRVVRRLELDDALARAVRRLGVEIVEGARVEGVERAGDGAVVKIDGDTIRARLVIGADGVGSTVRRALGLPAGSLRAQVVEVDTEVLASDGPSGVLRFDASDASFTGYAWDFPTIVGDRRMVCRGVYLLRLEGETTDVADVLSSRLRALGLDPHAHVFRRYAQRGFDAEAALGSGPVLLVGEAAGIDPVTGEGIAQAIEHGALAGRFAAEVLERGTRVSAYRLRFLSSRLGCDLAVRRRLVRAFYGAERARVERLLVESADALAVGCRHFAGATQSLYPLLRLVLRVGGEASLRLRSTA